MFYLKTTETCNLNCLHCFTSGSKGAKIYWNHVKVADWLHRISKQTQYAPHAHFEFHGGEPFLADIASLQYVYDNCQNLWQSQSWGITTNLTFKLDHVVVKLFISVTKGTIAIEPIELLEWVKSLGVKELALERLTMNGSAKQNLHIFPTNIEQDQWFLKMHHQSEEHNARDWFDNEFLETIYDKFETNFLKGGTFCRDCEEKLFTINADGTISGCPNSAPEFQFGTIDDDIESLINSPIRIENIACERSRDPRCYSCDVFDFKK